MITTLVIVALCAIMGIFAPVIMENVQIFLENLTVNAFTVDILIEDITNSSVISAISDVFSAVAIDLLVLLFVKKGFETYILYTDGDAESDPIGFMTLFIKGIAVAMCGNTILNWFFSIVSGLSGKALDAVKSSLGEDYQWDNLSKSFSEWNEDTLSELLFGCIVVVVFCIVFWIVYFNCMKNGLLLFILRIAMPLCAIGLINSDKGIFKSYVMTLTKTLITIMTQIALTQLAFSIMVTGYKNNNLISGGFLGIIVMLTALNIPQALGEFLIPSSGGGNLLMKAYYGSSIARGVKRFLLRGK